MSAYEPDERFDQAFEELWTYEKRFVWLALLLVCSVVWFLIFVGVRLVLKYT